MHQSLYNETLQLRLESAVATFRKDHNGEKPSLLHISKQDYRHLVPYRDDAFRYGLAIRGVTTIGLEEMEPGKFLVVS
jgi:hypothetical protein